MKAEERLSKSASEIMMIDGGVVQMKDLAREAIELLRRVHERNRGDGIRPTSSKLDDEIEAFLEGGVGNTRQAE